MRRNTFVLFCIVTLAVLATGQTALADSVPTIIGGSNLLTSSSATQLQTWLGQGPIQLTNIFSHTFGDGKSGYDFHAAANGQGATFDIYSVAFTNPRDGSLNSAIIGGYNPQSWNGGAGY